jgi:cytochrome c peroxidase
MFDGANCPNLPPRDRASHSLLLDRGLFRIPISWPPKNADGTAKPVEFTIEVVHDPTGCNRNAVYGLNSPSPTVNVYRRPRPSSNLKYVIAGAAPVVAKTGERAITDPTTGEPSAMNLMTDAREASLTTQALSAIMGHEEARTAPSADILRQIVEFESQVYTAQVHVYGAGRFDRKGVPVGLGPQALRDGHAGTAHGPVFGAFDAWMPSPKSGKLSTIDKFSASVARGAQLFEHREFALSNTAYAPQTGARKATCATCHSASLTGQAPTAGWMDLGTTTHPLWTEPAAAKSAQPDFSASPLPVFKVTCRADAQPHALGRVIYTTDPGRALISGRCADVGSIVMQQLRALAARAPYFSNGSAETLRDAVDFHNRRYQMNLTEAEKDDLANFLGAL